MTDSVKITAENAKSASIGFMGISHEQRNRALLNIAAELEKNSESIFEANKEDLKDAKENNIPGPLAKRLFFGEEKLKDVIAGIKDLANLPDPIGKITYSSSLSEGLDLYRTTCPIGVIGIIFESRPDALVQISTLCLKSGNSVILKGGTEAKNTNSVLTRIIEKGADDENIPGGWISLLKTRTDVTELLSMENEVDLLIPRGSNEFVKMVMENTKIPVLGHADGICHIYIDEKTDSKKAVEISLDGKSQYPSACNATETILVNENAADKVLPVLHEVFTRNKIQIFGCEKTAKIIPCEITDDWKREYLDLLVSVKIVKDVNEAVEHINKYGSGHTDAIITDDEKNAAYFMSYVDSGNVFHNCSTRFSDGFRYGFGAEVGISTSKIHARGPVGLEGLVTYKYRLFGKNHRVEDFASGKKEFSHRDNDKPMPF